MKKIFVSLFVLGLTTSFVFGQAVNGNSTPIQEKTTVVPAKNELSLTFGTFNLEKESGEYYDHSGAYSFSFGFKHHFSDRFSMSLNNEFGFFNYSMLNNFPSADVSQTNLNLMSHYKVVNLKDISFEFGIGVAYTSLTDNSFKTYFREGFNTNTQTKTYESFTTQVHSIDENIAVPLQFQINKAFEKCKFSLGYKYNFTPEDYYNYNLGSRFYIGLSIPL